MDLRATFDEALNGKDNRVIQIPHPWLLVLAQNAGGFSSLLVKAELPKDLFVGDAKGFSVQTARKVDDSFIQIKSSEKGPSELFLKLVEFIIFKTSSAASREGSLVELANSVAEFKRFMSRRGGRLSGEEIQGLFAEVMALIELIGAGIPSIVALSSWKGPFYRDGKGLHDFTFPDGRGLEIKSCHQPATAIRLSSPHQALPTGDPLDILVLPVDSVPVGFPKGVSLREALASCESLLSADPILLEIWNKALEAFNTDFSDEYYENFRFIASGWRRFAVVSGFPVVDTAEIPKAIIRLTYSLSLHELTEFEASVDLLWQEIGEGLNV